MPHSLEHLKPRLQHDNLPGPQAGSPEISPKSVIGIDYHESRWHIGSRLAEIGLEVYDQDPSSFPQHLHLPHMQDTLHWLTDKAGGYLQDFPNEFALELPAGATLDEDSVVMPFLDFGTQIINAMEHFKLPVSEGLRRESNAITTDDLDLAVATLRQITPVIPERNIRLSLRPSIANKGLQVITDIKLLPE